MPCARAAVGPQRTEQEMKVLSGLCTIPTLHLELALRLQSESLTVYFPAALRKIPLALISYNSYSCIQIRI